MDASAETGTQVWWTGKHITKVLIPHELVPSSLDKLLDLVEIKGVDLAIERERQLTTTRANQTTGLTNREQQIEHRKSRSVLSARFPVVNWRSCCQISVIRNVSKFRPTFFNTLLVFIVFIYLFTLWTLAFSYRFYHYCFYHLSSSLLILLLVLLLLLYYHHHYHYHYCYYLH